MFPPYGSHVNTDGLVGIHPQTLLCPRAAVNAVLAYPRLTQSPPLSDDPLAVGPALVGSSPGVLAQSQPALVPTQPPNPGRLRPDSLVACGDCLAETRCRASPCSVYA